MFIRQQFSAYWRIDHDTGEGEHNIRFDSPLPHGRNDYTGKPSDWGPNSYGYTDFDDYHLTIFGA